MTDKVKNGLSKASMVLTIVVVLVTFVATAAIAFDLTSRTAQAVDALTYRLEVEVKDRQEADKTLLEQIRSEREARKDEYTKIQVKLTELDTKLIYIQQGINNLQN